MNYRIRNIFSVVLFTSTMQSSLHWIASITVLLSIITTSQSQITSNPCQTGPCLNGATCSVLSSTQYTCTCKQGFLGTNCQIASTACSSNPCGVGGLCNFNQDGSAVCFCLSKQNLIFDNIFNQIWLNIFLLFFHLCSWIHWTILSNSDNRMLD